MLLFFICSSNSIYKSKMISDEDDNSTLVVKQKPEKHAARISDNDKANLLSSGEEKAETEEYTGDIFFNFSRNIVGNILMIYLFQSVP